jgi:hypothetical protein
MPKRRYPFAAFSLSLVVSVFFLISCGDGDNSTGPDSSGAWSWASMGSGVNDRVFAFAEYDNELIIGGYFDTAGGRFEKAGGDSAANIACWEYTRR